MAKRQLNDTEKQQVIAAQRETDGSLRCYISGDVINLQRDDYEFDHIEPYSQGGETNLGNIRVVLKSYNRRKSDQSLNDVRDNLRLERLFRARHKIIYLIWSTNAAMAEWRPWIQLRSKNVLCAWNRF